MHPDDADNFLKLATSLKIILGRTIRIADLPRAETLLKDYLTGFLSVRPLFINKVNSVRQEIESEGT